MNVDDVTLHPRCVTKGLVQRTKDLYEGLKEEMLKVKLELSVAKSCKEGESMVEVTNPYLVQKPSSFCREEGLGMDDCIHFGRIKQRTNKRKFGNKAKKRRAMFKKRQSLVKDDNLTD